ncbi:MAG: MATE family efflux transporter [Planctomycetota bacterium]|nr:MATE family efflux transporter [Planctomycetota bacterium]
MSKAPAPSSEASSIRAEVWRQAWPTVVAMTSYTVMQFIDSIMLARISPEAVAAQGNGGVWVWTAVAAMYGIVTLVNTFASQNMGAGRPREAAKYAWAGVWVSIACAAGVILPWGFFLPTLFGALGHEPSLVGMEVAYGQVLCFGAVLTLSSKAISGFFFGIHWPKVIAVSAILGNIANLLGNYALIYGPDGIPEWGLPGIPFAPRLEVTGAAIGTLFGTGVELLIPLAVLLRPRFNHEFHFWAAWKPSWGPIKDLLRLGWAPALQNANEMLAWAIFMSVLVGKFGTIDLAAGWATLRYMHLSFMPAIGFSVACSSLVGKAIGAGDKDRATKFARVTVRMALVYMTCWGVAMILFRRPMMEVFASAPGEDPIALARMIDVGSTIMVCAALFQFFDAIGIVYSGALRGAGDTIWPAALTVILSWSMIIGVGGALAHWCPQWGSLGPWIGASIYISVLGLVLGLRFESNRWRSINVLASSTPPGGD